MIFRNRLVVLAYHRVIPEFDPLFPEQTTAEDFEKHLMVLSRYFRVFTLSDAISMLDRKELPARSVVITFDDGYEDNATVALPLLDQLGLKATFFIATKFIGGDLMWNDKIIEAIRNCERETVNLSRIGLGNVAIDDSTSRRMVIDSLIRLLKHMPEPKRSECAQEIIDETGSILPKRLMMSENQLRLLTKSGMEIGAHTVSHPILAKQNDSDAEWEISESRKFLSNLLDVSISSFAYPNGRFGTDYNEVHVNFARKAGFDVAASTRNGSVRFSSNRYELPRYGVWDKSSFKFAARLCQWIVTG